MTYSMSFSVKSILWAFYKSTRNRHLSWEAVLLCVCLPVPQVQSDGRMWSRLGQSFWVTCASRGPLPHFAQASSLDLLGCVLLTLGTSSCLCLDGVWSPLLMSGM